MNDFEREAIILNSAWGMIDGMVNWAIFVKNDCTAPTMLMFNTMQHSRLFAILLGDFLSQVDGDGKPPPLGLLRTPSNAQPSDKTFLFHLRQVCASPKLGLDTSALSVAVEDFGSWLEVVINAQRVNLSAINIEPDLRVRRLQYLKICGDIAKHNLLRLEVNVDRLFKLLETANYAVTKQQVYLAVENSFEWFHDHIFQYHSSQLAEFLNNIRWEIYDYLKPEFRRSWHLTDQATPVFARYSYRTPSEIADPIARRMYWELMNRSRGVPNVRRFVVDSSFKTDI